ncbi:hemolysin family protein [Pedobacter suwonensis]|uniref:hemolysin family protein n=1 Tax=Pedobacter suwonensis TaxID=332999 RepID=UPI002635DAC3|nr:hemolysin family protein [uncultured Pedobacter sp.]
MVIFIISILILLNAYFSLAEIALIAVKKGQLEDEAQKGNKGAQQALDLIKDPEAFLSAVQVGITLLGIIEGIYGGELVANMLKPFLVKYTGLSATMAHAISLFLGIGLITYLTIVIGELLPKSIALQVPLKISVSIAPSLAIFSKIAFPFIKLLTLSTRFLLNILSIRKPENEKITESDIKSMLSMAHKQGTLEKDELFLHENIFVYNDLTAERIMKPIKIVSLINFESSRAVVAEQIKKRPYSYFPIKENNTGLIKGVLSTKDFFINPQEDWHALIQQPCRLSPNMDTGDIFQHFKKANADFGMVTEDGTHFLGIVTMQDIMESVFGDMPEREDYRSYFYQLDNKTWMAEGFIHLQRIRRELSLDWIRAYETKYVTVAELLEGELHGDLYNGASLELHNLVFTVEQVSEKEVGKVKIQKREQEQ